MEAIFNVPEIVILVCQSCDNVGDGRSLASACRYLASIWRAHTAAILHPLLKASTAGFDQALLAVRATNLVCDAFQANQLPPRPTPLLSLGVHIRKPNISELKQVRDLQHLARCAEYMYFRGSHDGQLHPSDEPSQLSGEERTRMGDRFHYAVYRVLVAGAVLTREYLEPLFSASAQAHAPPGFLHRLTGLGGNEAQNFDELTQKDVEYLERFPVYDLEAGQEKWEPAFGELAGWLLNDIEATFTNVKPPKSPVLGMGAEELGRLQEVTFFLAAYELVTDKLFNSFPVYPDSDDDSTVETVPPPFPGRARKVPIAMFELFRPEVVSMPARLEDSSWCYLINECLVSEEQRALSPWTADLRRVLEVLHKESGRPNLRNGYASPPPALRFVEFVLAKFFRARFRDGLFDEESPRHMGGYRIGFLQHPSLFRDRSIRFTTWLFAEDKAPRLGYRRIYW